MEDTPVGDKNSLQAVISKLRQQLETTIYSVTSIWGKGYVFLTNKFLREPYFLLRFVFFVKASGIMEAIMVVR